MRYRKLGNSSLDVSLLGVGALHFGVFCDQYTTNNIVWKAFDLGINFIDTAPMYGSGKSEMFVKNAIKGHRKDVILATKVGLEPVFDKEGTFGVEVVPLSRQNIRRSLEKSLNALDTDYIDLFQVHAFDSSTPMEESLAELESLVKEGKVRYVGCSNYDDKELLHAAGTVEKHKSIDFVSLQCHYNLIERRAEQKIVPICVKRNYGIICYRALCRGILSGKYKNNQPLPEQSRAKMSNRVRRWLTQGTLLLTDSLEEFAKKRNRTLIELSIAWLLERPAVASVLAGMRNIEQLEICARGADGKLSDEDLNGIDKIIDNLGLREQVNYLPDTFLEK